MATCFLFDFCPLLSLPSYRNGLNFDRRVVRERRNADRGSNMTLRVRKVSHAQCRQRVGRRNVVLKCGRRIDINDHARKPSVHFDGCLRVACVGVEGLCMDRTWHDSYTANAATPSQIPPPQVA